jgi:hypothetical protein
VREVLKPFSDFIQKSCQESKGARRPDQPYYEGMEMKKFLVQIMKAFYAMREAALAALKSLPKNCRPNNWFGYVVYQSVDDITGVKTIPASGAQTGSNGGSETSGTKKTYTATVFVEEGKASSAKASASVSYNMGGTTSLRDICSPKTGLETVSTSYGGSTSAAGVGAGSVEFGLNVHDAAKKYDFSMKFQPVMVTGNSTKFSITTATACKASSKESSTPFQDYVGGGDPYKVEGKMDSGIPNYLWGSRTEKPPLANRTLTGQNSSTVLAREIQVRWSLWRMPAK